MQAVKVSITPGVKLKKTARNSLLRIAIEKGDKLHVEIIPDFRAWVLEKVQEPSTTKYYPPK